MSISFNVIEKGQPGVVGGGEKKFYANTVTVGEINVEGITKKVEKISTVSGADIRAVIYATVDVMIDELSEGRIVRLGDLGDLRVSISSEGLATAEEVSSNSVRGSKVIFRPGKMIRNMLKTLTFKKL